MNESFGSKCRPFRPRFCYSLVTTRLRAWLLAAGASRLVSLHIRPNCRFVIHFQTSLEEAEVSRPGREAGIGNGHDLERRRCGTAVMRQRSIG